MAAKLACDCRSQEIHVVHALSSHLCDLKGVCAGRSDKPPEEDVIFAKCGHIFHSTCVAKLCGDPKTQKPSCQICPTVDACKISAHNLKILREVFYGTDCDEFGNYPLEEIFADVRLIGIPPNALEILRSALKSLIAVGKLKTSAPEKVDFGLGDREQLRRFTRRAEDNLGCGSSKIILQVLPKYKLASGECDFDRALSDEMLQCFDSDELRKIFELLKSFKQEPPSTTAPGDFVDRERSSVCTFQMYLTALAVGSVAALFAAMTLSQNE